MVQRLRLLLIFLLFMGFIPAEAKEFPVQARLFAGLTTIDPKDVNEEIEALGFEKIDDITQYGVEMTYPVIKLLDVGLRYTRRYVKTDEVTPTPDTDYYAKITQDSVSAILRVPFLKLPFLRLDVFGAAGGSNTVMRIKTAALDGELSRKASGDWFSTPYFAYGGSLALGYKMFYVAFEGGLENNKIDNLKRSANLNNNVETIDLSGSYFMVALVFDGVKASDRR